MGIRISETTLTYLNLGCYYMAPIHKSYARLGIRKTMSKFDRSIQKNEIELFLLIFVMYCFLNISIILKVMYSKHFHEINTNDHIFFLEK